MSTFLQSLPEKLDGINEWDIIEPSYPIEEADSQIGEMSDLCKRLFTLGRQLEKEAKQYQLNAQFCSDEAEKLELNAKAHELADKSNTIKSIMWISLRDEFGVWSDSVGVRVGFKVVASSETENNIPPIIRGLFNL